MSLGVESVLFAAMFPENDNYLLAYAVEGGEEPAKVVLAAATAVGNFTLLHNVIKIKSSALIDVHLYLIAFSWMLDIKADSSAAFSALRKWVFIPYSDTDIATLFRQNWKLPDVLKECLDRIAASL